LERLGLFLAGSAIAREVGAGRILLEPFAPERLNATSYTFAVGAELFEVVWSAETDGIAFDRVRVPLTDGAWLLEPRKLYLATTAERIGSDDFAMRLTGRPALGLAGLFVQVTADLGHQGAKHRWTLEFVPVAPTRLAPLQPVGQVAFVQPTGEPSLYRGAFAIDTPLGSTLHQGRM
jgi:dCTP deaminase